MRDLFSGCVHVRACVYTCRSRLGMSICGCVRNVDLLMVRNWNITDTCITRGRRWRTEVEGGIMTFIGD